MSNLGLSRFYRRVLTSVSSGRRKKVVPRAREVEANSERRNTSIDSNPRPLTRNSALNMILFEDGEW